MKPALPDTCPEFFLAQTRAMAAVHKAKKEGLLPALILCQCVDCGRWPAQVYDHRDYSKPAEVEPVCQKCNLKRGRAKWETPGAVQYGGFRPSSKPHRAHYQGRT